MNNQPDVVLMDINLEGGREGIEDRETVERIHERVPDAPVLSKPVYGQRLAEAVAAVIPPHH